MANAHFSSSASAEQFWLNRDPPVGASSALSPSTSSEELIGSLCQSLRTTLIDSYDQASTGIPSASKEEENAKKMPFLRFPIEGQEGHWLAKKHEAPEWWDLFYDLAVVAVLTIFSTNHELNRPKAIPVFLSYYAIVCWVWTSQIHYDIRYQALDGWHKVAKAVQIMTFVYMGAASGDWNPGMIRIDEPYLATQSQIGASEHRTANESFKTVLAAFIISRGFLACQYTVYNEDNRILLWTWT
ncbi:uncharacterized protein IL334_000332 [Kwoniella shivajii]|uniref:Uncharacterized protein n=1 Tax=Kwoniella shivajii TaxID=564305 RepID=A0ABZ1CNW1_9TREE|nr:hypothetical protein IL334_000332 [Kwoniella shivajii]